jgi:hypothetical protein
MTKALGRAGRLRRFLQECSGACGDLGTFIPHVIGAITVAGLAPAGLLFGFGVCLIGSGLFYGVPMAVQPMKAVSAVILTDGLRPGEVAAAGIVLGAVLFGLGATGMIGRIARLIPQSVSAGLQLGLGLLMGMLGIGLVLKTPWLGLGAAALLLFLMRIPYCPAAPLTLLVATLAGWITHEITLPDTIIVALSLPPIVLPTWPEMWRSIELAAIPQLPLTLTNAVIVTASLCRDLFPARASRASERAASTCQVGLVGCRRLAVGIGVYCQPMLQISAQTWNFWVLEALCSAAVTRSRRRWKRLLI